METAKPYIPHLHFGAIAGRLLPIMLLCALSFGCATTTSETHVGFLPDVRVSVEENLTLKVGDLIELEFVYWPELNITQQVRKDGKICVGELGFIEAAGRQCEELGAELEKQYAYLLKDPVINVLLINRDPKFLYVGGQVRTPGLLTLMPMARQKTATYQNDSNRIIHGDRVTLTQAIVAMGGLIEEKAHAENVVVIRYVDGKRYAAIVNMNKSMADVEAETVYLAPDDIVFVPRTKIERLNRWVDQHINKPLPHRLWLTLISPPWMGGIGTIK